MSKLFEKSTEMLKGDTLTENNIISLKNRISGNQCSLTDGEVETLREMFWDCEYQITIEHSMKGIEYLRRKCLKNNGQNRATKQVKNMPDQFFDAIRDYRSFTFVGFEGIQFNQYTGNYHYMPIWRIHTKNGDTFDYCMDMGLIFKMIDSSITSPYLNLVA